jgi:catechol 2,3-dioxygenase-like lactoylglutathione lyase family enzyme
MSTLIRSLSLFAAGTLFGVFLMQPGAAQQSQPTGLRLNHVGIYAKDFDESMRFYTQTMGFREAFTIRDANGKPTLAYLHITRDTFLEIAPSTAERPVGLSHIGIWPRDLTGTVSALRQRGAKMDDPRTGATRTSITNLVDPNGVRLEFLDFLPDSAPAKAMESFKQ